MQGAEDTGIEQIELGMFGHGSLGPFRKTSIRETRSRSSDTEMLLVRVSCGQRNSIQQRLRWPSSYQLTITRAQKNMDATQGFYRHIINTSYASIAVYPSQTRHMGPVLCLRLP